MVYVIIGIVIVITCLVLYAFCKIAAKADEEIESLDERETE